LAQSHECPLLGVERTTGQRQIAVAPAAQRFVEKSASQLDREKRAGVNTGVNIRGMVGAAHVRKKELV
jgi:hypothetical protein